MQVQFDIIFATGGAFMVEQFQEHFHDMTFRVLEI